MTKILLITITGHDKPGLTSAFAQTLAESNATLLDIGQAVIHDALALGLMVKANPSSSIKIVEAKIQEKGRELGVTARLNHVSEGEYTAAQLMVVTSVFAAHSLNIDIMDRLSARASASDQREPRMCIEFTISGDQVGAVELRCKLLTLADHSEFDIAVQEDSIFRRIRRLIAFDMDSTLIQMEVIDELARMAGVGEQVSAITAAAMRGDLDFNASFRKRLSLLQGLSAGVLDDVAARLPITPGAHRLLGTLKALGYKTAILSGGFTCFAQKLKDELGFDYIYANELGLAGGLLTGEPVGEIIDGARKAELLKQIAAREGIALEQTIAVGDGANDLPMLSVAGLGVAFHAKPLVRGKAKHSISRMGLDALLYLLGLRDRHMEKHSEDSSRFSVLSSQK
ncbi:MAG: phosphoserine phosphatase SerB [Acidobacteria bacterium]|nr:MAG: phosphoserine phosphatase SerB [Acidobacteriota bacterium]